MHKLNPLNLTSEEDQHLLYLLLTSNDKRWYWGDRDYHLTTPAGLDVSFTLTKPVLLRRRKEGKTGYRVEVMGYTELGRGSYGTVYPSRKTLVMDDDKRLVYPTDKKKKRVVKIAKKEYKSVIEREYEFGKHAAHLGMKKPIYDGPSSFTVMKRVPGIELYELIEQDQNKLIDLPLLERLDICIALLERYLVEVNSLQLVHRDIKPENIKIKRSNHPEHKPTIHFLDYQLAKHIDEHDQGQQHGTSIYTAPEFFYHSETTKAYDGYSLARIISLLFHAKSVNHSEHVNRLFQLELSKHPNLRVIGSHIIGLSQQQKEDITDVLSSMMAFDEKNRLSIEEGLTFFKQLRENVISAATVSSYPLNATNYLYEFTPKKGFGREEHEVLAAFFQQEKERGCCMHWSAGITYSVEIKGELHYFILDHDVLRIDDDKRGVKFAVLKQTLGKRHPEHIDVIGYLRPARDTLTVHKSKNNQMIQVEKGDAPWKKDKVMNDYRFYRRAKHLGKRKPLFDGFLAYTQAIHPAGIPLWDMLDDDASGKKPFTTQQRLLLSISLLQALQTLHDQGYVHRNINPEDIYVEYKDGKFNISIQNLSSAVRKNAIRPLTVNPIFASPEYFANGTLSSRSDGYSMARILAMVWRDYSSISSKKDDQICAHYAYHITLENLFEGLDNVPKSVQSSIKETLSAMLKVHRRERISVRHALEDFNKIDIDFNESLEAEHRDVTLFTSTKEGEAEEGKVHRLAFD